MERELFMVCDGRLHIHDGQDYVPAVDVIAMLDRLADEDWYVGCEDRAERCLRRLNAHVLNHGTLPEKA